MKKIDLFNSFWIIYLVEFITPFVLLLNYLTGLEPFILIKIPPVLYLIIILLYHIKNKIVFQNVSILFLIFGIFSLFWGLYENRIVDQKFLMHIYYTTIPILGISFGFNYAKKMNIEYYNFFLKIINICFYLTLVVLLFYFYFHFVTGQITYWGFGTDMHVLIPFILNQSKYSWVLIGTVFVLFSGKRATTLNIVFETLVYFSSTIFNLTFKRLILYSPVLIIICFSIFFASQQGAFSRLESSFNFDSEDEYAVTVATGGRWQEVTGIVSHHNENKITWILGAGFGGRYLWDVPLSDYTEIKHYAHFTPIAYIFIFGVPFTIILYIMFIKSFFKGFSERTNPFFITYCVSVFGSFFGANLLIDIKIWVFTGIALFLISNKKEKHFINSLVLK